jgi:hypothetical protein
VHADGKAHHHAQADHSHADVSWDAAAEPQTVIGDICCASSCAVALTALTLATVSAPMTTAIALLPVSQDGKSAHLDRLQRPPRTPCIA